jgi:hypothetical protein
MRSITGKKQVKNTLTETSKRNNNGKKKSNKQKLTAECFDLWGKCIIARDRTCRSSGDDSRLSAHHIRSRTHHSTRFNLQNGICLSWKVHFLQKANPERFQDMVIEIIGQEEYDRLKKMSLVVVKHTVSDLEQIKFELQAELKRIRNGIDFDKIPF